MTRVGRCLIAAAIVGSGVVAMAAPASASLKGPCTAQGFLEQQKKLYLARTTDEATIPREGDVVWRATTPGKGSRVVKGEVEVEFPAPVNGVTIGEWGEDGKTTDSSQNNGTYSYSFSKLLAGIEIPVTGTSTEPGQIPCSGKVVVTIEGTSPLAWASLIITAVVGLNLWLAMRARKPGVPG